MKALLYLALVVAGVWLWRSLTLKPNAPKDPAVPPQGQPTAMVRCHHCGVHLPANEAMIGPDGRPYCSQAHLP